MTTTENTAETPMPKGGLPPDCSLELGELARDTMRREDRERLDAEGAELWRYFQAQQRADRFGSYALKRGAEMRGMVVDWWVHDEMLAKPDAMDSVLRAVRAQRDGGQQGAEYVTLSAYLASGAVHNEDSEYARFRWGMLLNAALKSNPEEYEEYADDAENSRLTAGGWERWIDTGDADTSADAATRPLSAEEWRRWVTRTPPGWKSVGMRRPNENAQWEKK